MARFPVVTCTCSVFRRGNGGDAFAESSVTALDGRGGIGGLFSAGTLTLLATAAVDRESVAVRADAGAVGGGGGGARLAGVGGGALKFFCWFSAAIRSASVVNCGSSTSAIVKAMRMADQAWWKAEAK